MKCPSVLRGKFYSSLYLTTYFVYEIDPKKEEAVMLEVLSAPSMICHLRGLRKETEMYCCSSAADMEE